MKHPLRCRLFGHKLTAVWLLSKQDADGHAVMLQGRADGSEHGFACKRRRCRYFVASILGTLQRSLTEQ